MKKKELSTFFSGSTIVRMIMMKFSDRQLLFFFLGYVF